MRIALGRTARHILKLVLAGAMLAAMASTPAAAESRLALVIGNDTYEEVPQLDRAVADARAYRAVLEDERGFKVFYAENAGRREMNTRVAEFLAAIRPGDTAMIVYSGHGVQLESEQRDSLYLLPTDFPARDPGRGAERHFFDSESLNFARLAENVAARGAKLRIFVLDACRNNPFNRENGTRAIGFARGLGRIQSASGEFVIYAAAPGEVAFDSLPGDDADSRNSVFTRAFIKHFRSGTYLEDVANDVQAEVVRLARAANVAQEPYYSDGVAGRTCLEETCGAAVPEDARIVAEQEELYWSYCAKNDEPLYCKAFVERYPESWRVGLAQARLKVLAARDSDDRTGDRLAAVDATKGSGAAAPDTPPDTAPDADRTGTGPDGTGTATGDGLTPAPKSENATGAGADKDTTPPTGGSAAAKAPPDAPGGPDGDAAAEDPVPSGVTPPDGETTAPAGDAAGGDAAATGGPDAAESADDGDALTPPSTGDAAADDGDGVSRESGAGDRVDLAAVDPGKISGLSTDPIRPPRDQLRDTQARLEILGHSPGPIDGLMGRRTRAAITDFQRGEGMEPDGAVSEALLARLSRAVPDEKLDAFWADREAADRARAERARAARERAARERAARRETTRERRTRTTAPEERTRRSRDADAAAEAARRRALAERAKEREAARRAAAEAARRRAAEDDKPGIRLNTRNRTSGQKPFYCNNPTKRWKDPSCF